MTRKPLKRVLLKLSGEALETRTNEIAALVRCPVCQGMSIAETAAAYARTVAAP